MSERTETVEHLQGGENTPFGWVDHTIHEADGVDVVFIDLNGDRQASHFDYGAPIEVTSITATPASPVGGLRMSDC